MVDEYAQSVSLSAKRLMNGDFSYDHLCKLFLWIRDRFNKELPTIYEVANFIAHPHRDLGSTSNILSYIQYYIFHGMNHEFDRNFLPIDFKAIATDRLEVFQHFIQEEDPELTPDVSRKALKSILKRFFLGSAGYYQIISDNETPLETKLLKQLLKSRKKIPVMLGDKIFIELRHGLISSELIDEEEDKRITNVYEAVILFSLTVMHQCTIYRSNPDFPPNVAGDFHENRLENGLLQTIYRHISASTLSGRVPRQARHLYKFYDERHSL